MRLKVYRRWEDSMNNGFLAVLDRNPSAKVVDLGCGDGNFSVRVKEKISCNEMWGVDVDSLRKAEKIGISVIRADLNNVLPFEAESFDVVLSNQVIEHLFYPVKFIKEIYGILKSGGYAVISTENLASWDNILSLFLGYTPFSMQFDNGFKIGNPLSPHEKNKVVTYPPHSRIFTWKGLIELARFVGFKVENAIGSGHIFGKFGELINKKKCRFITIKVRK